MHRIVTPLSSLRMQPDSSSTRSADFGGHQLASAPFLLLLLNIQHDRVPSAEVRLKVMPGSKRPDDAVRNQPTCSQHVARAWTLRPACLSWEHTCLQTRSSCCKPSTSSSPLPSASASTAAARSLAPPPTSPPKSPPETLALTPEARSPLQGEPARLSGQIAALGSIAAGEAGSSSATADASRCSCGSTRGGEGATCSTAVAGGSTLSGVCDASDPRRCCVGDAFSTAAAGGSAALSGV